jgi:Ala-tRNA(Pro) deacylase
MSIREYLRSRNVPFVALLHRPVPSAARLAHSVHVAGVQVAKAVLIRTPSAFVLAVVPSTHRVALDRVSELLGQAGLAIATESDVEQVFHDCECGALPPFGRVYGLTTLVDVDLALQAEIIVQANTRHEAIRMRYRDFELVEGPERGRFSAPIHPRRNRFERQAG